MIVGVLTTCHT